MNIEIIDEKSELTIINYTEKNNLKDIENKRIKYLVDFNDSEWTLNPIDINQEYQYGDDSFVFDLLDDAIVFVQEKQDEINRGKYIISEPIYTEENMVNVDIEIAEDEVKALRNEARLRKLSLEQLIKVILVENLLNLEKSKIIGKFNSIIDIYDILVNPDLLLNISEDTIIISPNGKRIEILKDNETQTPSYDDIISKLI